MTSPTSIPLKSDGTPVKHAKREFGRTYRIHLSKELAAQLNGSISESDSVERTRLLVEALLKDAVRESVSDIHLDPLLEGYRLRMRIDGELSDTMVLDHDTALHILRAFKGHAVLDPGYALKPQEGRAEFRVADRAITVRVVTVPTVAGEKLTLRLLSPELAHLRLEELGLSAGDYRALSDAIHDARGMILVSGPTGSGKTTTAYAILHKLQEDNRAIVTLEEPVEYAIEGVTQLQVNPRQGFGLAEGMKALLRLDPDVIFMREMRDGISVHAAVNASDSGHTFLGTLHARDVAGTVTVLRNFGLADHEIASSLDLVVAQRLVRRLCSKCRHEEAPTEEESHWLKANGQPVPAQTWHAGGCESCHQTGYRGRVGIFEVYRVREQDADLIMSHADEHTLRRRIRQGGILSLLEDDLFKVAAGTTSLSEIRAVGGMGFYGPQNVAVQSSPA